MENKVVKKDKLLNKNVRINLFEAPNDLFVKVVYSDENDNEVEEIRYKKDVFNEIDKLVVQDKLKKAHKTIFNKKTANGIKQVDLYTFETSMKSKKTSIKVVPHTKGMLIEDKRFLENLTKEVRSVHFQGGKQILKAVLTGGMVLTILTGSILVGWEQDSANKEYEALKDYRDHLVTQDNTINVFGEKWTDEVYVAYQENLKDNVDTPEELAAYDKFWNGEELESLKEKRALLNQWSELTGDYENAKEEVGKKLGN